MADSDHRVSHVTFTLPGDYKWTTTEAALQEAHDQEYELRMAFFWECQRLKEENERLRKAGDDLITALDKRDDVFDNSDKRNAINAWNAAKEGRPNG